MWSKECTSRMPETPGFPLFFDSPKPSLLAQLSGVQPARRIISSMSMKAEAELGVTRVNLVADTSPQHRAVDALGLEQLQSDLRRYAQGGQLRRFAIFTMAQ